MDCCPCLCIFFPCANWPVICLVTHLHLCVGSSQIACSMALPLTSLSVGDRCGIFDCQYFFASGPFKALCNATFRFFTCHCPTISICHDSFGNLYSDFPLYSTSMQAFATRLASMFNHACQNSTIGCPLSWCPLMCKYVILHGTLCAAFLQVFSKSECATKGSTNFFDHRQSKTECPSHAMSIFPAAVGSVANSLCMVIRMPYRLATLL